MEVFCYPKEGEVLEQECLQTDYVCVVKNKQEDKRIKDVKAYMHIYKCDEKNNTATCI